MNDHAEARDRLLEDLAILARRIVAIEASVAAIAESVHCQRRRIDLLRRLLLRP